jgi:hypothetical protein
MTLDPAGGGPSRRPADPVARALGAGALVVATTACVFAMAGASPATSERAQAPVASAAARRRATGRRPAALPGPSTRPRPLGILRLDRRKRFPASVLPKVAAARRADRLDGATRADLTLTCAPATVDMGTWCIDASPHPVPPQDAGRDDFFYATRACAAAGGWLPSAAQLLGAVERVKLAGTIDDSELTATVDEDPADGRKDQREMSSTLFTTIAGSSAAGSQGVTSGSRGNPLAGEPDPQTRPADPQPATVQYMTVYDNRDKGGFAGGRPITTPERFRCAYAKPQGETAEER